MQRVEGGGDAREDEGDARLVEARVGAQLAQLLPIDEGLKYQLQGLTSVEQLLEEMDNILVELSGESDQTGS